MSGGGVWLEDLTWPEAKQRFAAGALVLVPIGAAAKAHGPHLPLKTDALTARALAERLLQRLPIVAAPVLGLGYYPAFTKFAGSQHLSAATFTAVVRELLDGFAAGRPPLRAAQHRRLDRGAARRGRGRPPRHAGPPH